MIDVPTELDEKTIKSIKKNLSNQEWRLEHLYYILNENGEKVIFKMNAAQKSLFKNRWFLNLILKARQRGITTFISVFFLDSVLFADNQAALIIAHTVIDARKIFETKIKFAFDNLPLWIKDQYIVDTNNTNELKFRTKGDENNLSSIAVATSGRSGTYQFLHVSEFGIICAKYPEKAKEIVTGSLQTVHRGNMVFIESTAMGRSGYFFDYCNEAQQLLASGKELTEMDFKFFFFAWWEDPKYVLSGDVTITTEMELYFKSIEEKCHITLSKEQKNWYVKKLDKLKEDMMREFPSLPEEAFMASIEGAYYSKQFNKLIADKRMRRHLYDPALQVYTFWDLGISDQMVVLFVQFHGNEVRLIDEYHASGEGLKHFVVMLQNKAMEHGYIYAGHFGPHDIEVREMSNDAKSRKQAAQDLGLRFQVVKRHSIDIGIDEVRMMLGTTWIDEEKCDYVARAIQEYRKEWDDELGVWMSKPLHNWASHTCDSIRMCAMSRKYIMGFGNIETNDPDKMNDAYFNQSNDSHDFDPHSPTGGAF
ncbi:terminase [Candidatus Dojkabacteria bacterium]|jgi:hypothetical protein|nr:terminase [Candidatus Dojkabacteria bacterium]